MTSGWKNTSGKSKHGTSRKSVEEQNHRLLAGRSMRERAKSEVLFETPCVDCGELMWYHRLTDGGKICPTDERY